MTLRPEVVHALATRDRQVQRELERQASEIFHEGEWLRCIESVAGIEKGEIVTVHRANGRWLWLRRPDGKLSGQSPNVGSSYFRLLDECVMHLGSWESDEPVADDGTQATFTNGNGVGWHRCSRCGVVLPEWPNRYWMTHDNSHIPLPNPDVGDKHVPSERSARPRAAA